MGRNGTDMNVFRLLSLLNMQITVSLPKEAVTVLQTGSGNSVYHPSSEE